MWHGGAPDSQDVLAQVTFTVIGCSQYGQLPNKVSKLWRVSGKARSHSNRQERWKGRPQRSYWHACGPPEAPTNEEGVARPSGQEGTEATAHLFGQAVIELVGVADAALNVQLQLKKQLSKHELGPSQCLGKRFAAEHAFWLPHRRQILGGDGAATAGQGQKQRPSAGYLTPLEVPAVGNSTSKSAWSPRSKLPSLDRQLLAFLEWCPVEREAPDYPVSWERSVFGTGR